MLLAIDVGNTNTVLGVYEGKRLLDHWRLETSARRTSACTRGVAPVTTISRTAKTLVSRAPT